jgi:peptidoglycan/LPS O-acetylase OafA/YrhL
MPNVQAFLAHLIYAQDILGYKAILSVYWTLCLEIQFYLFLIILLWVGQALRSFWFLWGVVFALSLIEQSGLADIAPRGVFLPQWFAFALGAMTYWVVKGKLSRWALLAAIAATIAFTPFRHAGWFIAASLTAGVIYLASVRGAMGEWLNGKTSQFLGRVSYSLYLFHPIVGWAAMSVALRHTNQWTALAVGLAVSVLSAWLAYLTVERYSVRFSRMVSLERRPLLQERLP